MEAIGYIEGLNGHTYRVTISGDHVREGSLTFAGERPVLVSMGAAERKFVGFKSQSCMVSVVTDRPLLDMYGESATDVSLRVVDTTGGEVVFDGYVVPFAYNQPYDGYNDVVEVNAVDRITAHKGVPYRDVYVDGLEYGTDRSALDIVLGIAERCGVIAVVVHANFPTGRGYSALSAHQVAQAGFLQDEVDDVDALSAVCKFFGLTAHMYGETLYLYDEHYYTHPNEGVTDCVKVARTNMGWTVVNRHASDVTSPLRDQEIVEALHGVTLNVERAYDAVQITAEGSESVLLPDVCSSENLEDNTGVLGSEERIVQNKTADYDYVQSRTPRMSKLMEFGLSQDGVITDNWTGDAVVSDTWKDGAIPLAIYHANRKRYPSDVLSAVVPLLSTSGNYVWMRGAPTTYLVRVGSQRTDKRYSHTGGYVKLKCKWIVTDDGTWANIEAPVQKNEFGTMHFVYLHVGEQRFVGDFEDFAEPLWTGSDSYSNSPIFPTVEGNMMPSRVGWQHWVNDVVIAVPNEGQVWVELAWRGMLTHRSGMYNFFIESLSVEAVGDKVNERHADMRHEYVSEPVDVLSASTLLTSRNSGVLSRFQDGKVTYGRNARGAVVPDMEWKADYMGVFAGGEYDDPNYHGDIPLSGILMRQLRERYGEPRHAYTMTAEGIVYPYKAVRYAGGIYTVESYEMDLYNSETKVTID